MAVSVLDAALTFVADTTQTDAALNQLPAKAERSFGEASAFAQRFNTVLDATAENIALAGAELPSLGQAFRTLRITGPDHLKAGLDNAKLAFESLQASGITAAGTLLQANIKVVERQLAYTKAIGETTIAIEAELAALNAEYAALGGSAAAKERAALAAKEFAASEKAATLAMEQQAVASESLATSFGGLSSVFSTIIGLGFVAHFAEGIAKSVDEIDDLSKATGLAIPQLVGLKNAMTEAGDDSSKLGAQLSKLASGLLQAETGSAQQRQTFRALGVQFNETTGQAPPLLDALLQISDHLKETGASGNTLGLAYQALGKNSVELISFLGQGSAAIQEQIGHYEELGAETARNVQSAAEFQKVEAQLSAELRGIGISVLPVLTSSLKQAKEAFDSLNIGSAVTFFKTIDAGFIELQGTVAAAGVKVRQAFNEMIRDPDQYVAAQKRAAEDLDAIWAKTAKGVRESLGILDKKVDDPFGIHQLIDDLGLAQKSIQEIGDEDPGKNLSEAAKRTLDAQLASIEAWKSGQHLAFETGKIDAAQWAEAQIKATGDAEQAQEQYLARLISGYHQAGEVQKEQAAFQELTTLKVKNFAAEQDALAGALHRLGEESKKFADESEKAMSKATQSVFANVPIADAFNPWRDAILGIRDAYEALGVEGVLPLKQHLADELAALDQLHEGYQLGIVSKDDYLRASLREIDTEIALARALGNSTKELERQRAAIRAQIPEHKRFGDAITSVSQQVGSAILQEGFAFGQGAVTIGQALRSITSVMIQEIAKQAAVRGAAKLAEALGEVWHHPAAAATDFASAAAWFALAGGISAAAGAVTGSGRDQGQPNAPGNLPPIQQTAATTAETNQSQLRNLPRFAFGALVSAPTLAIVGDSPSGGRSREAVVPLEGQALEELRQALSINGAGEVHNHFHYPNLKGIIDTKGLMKTQTRAAKKGQGRLTSTDTLRR